MIFLNTSHNTKRVFAIATVVYTFIALLVFGNMSQHYFELDDLAYLKDLDQIRQDPSALLSADRRLPGRPITDVALLAIQVAYQNNPVPFHIALVICHLIATLLLTLTFYRTGLNLELSLISGLFFLINLAHFRAVHWISCMAYPLAFSLGCIGILAYIAYQKNTHHTWYGISFLACILAILSHPAAIAFPAFLAYLTWQNKQPQRPILIIVLTALITLFALLKLFPHVPQTEHVTAAHQWQITDLIQHGFWYLGRLWVSTFTVFPKMSDIQTFDLTMGAIALIGVILLWHYRIFPIAHWGIWMCLSLVLFITNPNQTHFESGPSRHLYFASAGSAVILAWLCQHLSFKTHQPIQTSWLPKVCLIFFVTIVTSLSVIGLKKSEAFTYSISARTYLVNGYKETSTQLFKNAVAHAPELVSSAMYERFIIANLAEGIFLNDSLHQGLAHYPNNDILVALRMIYGFQSETADHQYLTDRIVKFSQDKNENVKEFVAISCLNLGYFYTTQSQNGPAETLFKGALKLKSGYPEATTRLSQIYLTQKRTDTARKLLHLALEYNPNHVELLQNLADIYHREQNWTQAEQLYKRVLTQDPQATGSRFKLGYIYLAQQKYDEALPHFQILTQQVPNNWQNFAYLGQCLHAQGHKNAAIQAYLKALKLNPNQPELKTLLNQLTNTN